MTTAARYKSYAEIPTTDEIERCQKLYFDAREILADNPAALTDEQLDDLELMSSRKERRQAEKARADAIAAKEARRPAPHIEVCREFNEDGYPADDSNGKLEEWINQNFDKVPSVAVVIKWIMLLSDPLEQRLGNNIAAIERRIAALEPSGGRSVDTVDKQIAPGDLRKELNNLQSRLAALESRPELQYQGVHVIGATYRPGALVTRSGGLWFCTTTTNERPGHSDAWKLIVKSGQVAE